MLGRKERRQLELFISGSLRQLIPDDHVLVRIVPGRSITIVTLDAGYGVARVFAELEARRIEAIVPTRREHPRKKGLFPPVGSNWMRDTIVSAVREAGILCRTANQMRRASKFIAQAFATAAHVHCERPVSAQTLSAGQS